MRFGILTFLATVSFVTGCGGEHVYRRELFAFDTRVEIVIAGLDDQRARQAISAATAELERLGNVYRREDPSDAGAAGKNGAALDRVASVLHDNGIRDAMINVGGDIMALGTKNGRRWRVGIKHPGQPGPLAILDLSDGETVSTAADHQQSVTVLIPPRPDAGAFSEAVARPLFTAGSGWRALARKMEVDQVLRVDSAGRVQASERMRQRLAFVDGAPATLETIR